MSEYFINDFHLGLISSDDDINGRKNGFLRMDNCELDQNGAVVLTGGTVRLDAVYPNTAHTIFSKFIGQSQYRYLSDTNGHTFRSNVTNTDLGGGGSTTRAAFLALFEYVLICSGAFRKKDDGTTTSNLGQGTVAAPAVSLNGGGILNATYQYIQVNVFVNASGGYRARSAPSPLVAITPVNQQVQVTPNNVSGIQNEVWIFRRGGLLQQYYRVARITSGYTNPFNDNNLDQDVLNSGVTLNPLALPVDSANLTDDILEMVGPINLRVLFFTKNAVYFSETNSPETYVPGQGAFFMGAPQTTESFLWAAKIANNVVLIGTTKDIYRLTGTLIELSDGTLDVTIRPLGIDAPPLNRDVAIYNNNLVYMAAYGWVLCDQYGATTPLCPPNVDVNYYGKTRYGVTGVPIFQNSTNTAYRYSCAIIRNKLFTVTPEVGGVNRVDAYDFVRRYWHSIRYISNNAPLMLKSQEDHTVIGFFDNDKFIKRLDDQFTFTFDNGPAANQTITLRTPFFDCGLPRNRKDAGTFKFKIDTGGVNVTLAVYTDGQGTGPGIIFGSINSNGMTEVLVDIQTFLLPNIFKSFQFLLTGSVATFRLSDISFTYLARPEQVTFYKVPITNFGIASKKRVRTWPFILDAIGGTVTFTPTIDGSTGTTSSFTTATKSTIYHYFSTDVFGVDYGGVFTSSTYFEVYEEGKPEIVQILPIPKKFDQLGPEDLAFYGKIRQFRVRLLALGTLIPYTIYFQDGSVNTGNITTVNNVEDTYPILIPKSASGGEIIRIELGPTTFVFYRYYMLMQVVKSGTDSDMEWIILGVQQNG